MGKKISKNQKKIFCCPRFRNWINECRIHYAYDDTKDLDETAWFVPDFGHLYYCPFCGAHIKGEGWGEYDIAKKPDIDFLPDGWQT
jgi:hypothetical protein